MTEKKSSSERLPFKRVLIANRGEIAVRVVRACRDLGLTSVAIYSEADRKSLHVRMADEAYCIGAAPSTESYLNYTRILKLAKEQKIDAIHPGYGFLSENAVFADACKEAGVIFVGPSGDIQRSMGEKTAARKSAQAAGVPIVPGAMEGLKSVNEARSYAEKIGYPVLLKAAAGGGGKGIRLVSSPDELEGSLRNAKSEAASAFGDDSIYMEKAVFPARHIEVQIMADKYGNVVHLGERECSIQRRHQKLVEESPSCALDDELREAITSSAVRLAKYIGYENAGTAEFILGPDRKFYFLEVNTRLQVEHPVTEFRTGLDLVKEQFRVAAGLPLSVTQKEIEFNGASIECRITAEDPLNKFLPSTGTITSLHEPSGPGIRVDSSLYPESQVHIYYDSLLSKLIVWGKNRQEAIERMQRALNEYTIGGVKTSIPFAQWVMQHDRFKRGDFSTSFIEEEWKGSQQISHHLETNQTAAIIAALLAHHESAASHMATVNHSPAQVRSRWTDLSRKLSITEN